MRRRRKRRKRRWWVGGKGRERKRKPQSISLDLVPRNLILEIGAALHPQCHPVLAEGKQKGDGAFRLKSQLSSASGELPKALLISWVY